MEEAGFKRILLAVQRDYPDLCFQTGKKFAFRPPRTIIIADFEQKPKDYGSSEQEICSLRLLHELGHAVLGHRNFSTDVERLKMERAAWDKAREFCERYQVSYDEEFIEMELDTYRDWLHQKSTCHICGQTCYQGADGDYHCPFCDVLRG